MNSTLVNALRVVSLFVATSSVALAGNDLYASSSWGPGLGAGLAIGLAAFGAASAQGKAASSALEGMARNPQTGGTLQTPMLIALVFMETLVLFSFVIAGKMGGLF
jgi:F-type H+-transporting ATPase subunit c